MHECELQTAIEIWGKGGEKKKEESERNVEQEKEGEEEREEKEKEEGGEEEEREPEIKGDLLHEDPFISFPSTSPTLPPSLPSWMSDEISFADLEIKSLLEGSSSPLRSSSFAPSSSTGARERVGDEKKKGLRQMLFRKGLRVSPTNAGDNVSNISNENYEDINNNKEEDKDNNDKTNDGDNSNGNE